MYERITYKSNKDGKQNSKKLIDFENFFFILSRLFI